MTSKQFLIFVFIGVVAVAAVVVPLNMYTDLYGLFRPARGRVMSIYGEERIAKYLHSYRYIPENFDGVLLGSSVSDNLDPRDFPAFRLYNASINGGNVEDLKPIAENIFHHGGMKLTVVCIHRFLTLDHIRKTDLMTPKQYWGALGSPQLVTAYVSRLAVSHGLAKGEYDERGTLRSGSGIDEKTVRKEIDKAVAEIQQGTASVGNYTIDPVALAELQGVIVDARLHSRQVVIFYPPNPEPVLAVRRAEFARYRDTINGLTNSTDIVVDFNRPEYQHLRTDYRNFVDAVHLSKAGASAVMAELSRIVSRPELVKQANLN